MFINPDDLYIGMTVFHVRFSEEEKRDIVCEGKVHEITGNRSWCVVYYNITDNGGAILPMKLGNDRLGLYQTKEDAKFDLDYPYVKEKQ